MCFYGSFRPIIVSFDQRTPEIQTQVSPKILEIVEQRMVAIEQRSAYLRERISHVKYFFITFFFQFSLIFLYID